MAIVFLVLHLPHDPSHSERSFLDRFKEIDLIGASLLIPAIICLLLAVQWGGNTYPWNNSRIIGLFVGAGCLLILFVYSQIRLGEKATLPHASLNSVQLLLRAPSCFSSAQEFSF